MDYAKEDKETRKFHFQRPMTIIQNIMEQPHCHVKNDGREKEGLRVRHAACMVYGLASLYISDSELHVFVSVSVSSCCSLLFCRPNWLTDWSNFTLSYLQCCLPRVLRFFPFTHRLDKVFWHYYFMIVRVISIGLNCSHTQCQALDRDNKSRAYY